MSYTALSHGGVARVSTMVVDAPLDMGGFGIKADRIEESTAGAGVTISPLKTDIIDEITPGAGLTISHPMGILLGLSASDNTRVYDDSEISVGVGVAYEKAKTLTIPAHYKKKQTCRVRTAIKASFGFRMHVQVYVNGVPAAAEHLSESSSFVTFTDVITVDGGDTVEMWVQTAAGIGVSFKCGMFSVGGDDVMPVLFTKGEAWP